MVLDRDGVINDDSGEFIKSVAEWRPIAGSLEAIAALTRGGFRVAVVTNQSGVGRGLFSEKHARGDSRSDERTRCATRAASSRASTTVRIIRTRAAIAASRRPRCCADSSAISACSLVGVPFVGDRFSDVDAADAVGARAILVRTGTGAATGARSALGAIEVFDDLAAAARALLAER